MVHRHGPRVSTVSFFNTSLSMYPFALQQSKYLIPSLSLLFLSLSKTFDEQKPIPLRNKVEFVVRAGMYLWVLFNPTL